MNPLLEAGLILWALALMVGAGDGLFFHLWRFRLFARSESRLEHLAHTLRAALLVPTLWIAFLSTAPGRLPLLVGLIAADWAVAGWDVFLERKSRTSTGGMPHLEYFIHVAATAFHSAAEAMTVSGVALGAGALADPSLTMVAELMLAAGGAVLVLHVALMHPRFAETGTAAVASGVT